MKKETYILLKRDYLYKANKPDKEWSIRFNYNHAIISKPFENLIYPSIKDHISPWQKTLQSSRTKTNA